MLIDSFMFFNEVDILEGRMEYLYDVVDYFVIVETNLTHSGKPKPLYYLENIHRYKKYFDKILYFPYAPDPSQYNFTYIPEGMDLTAPQWKLEGHQRDHIKQALKLFNDDAIVIVSDLDEIPKKDAIALAQNILSNEDLAIALEQEFFYYNFNQKQSMPWCGSVIARNSLAKRQGPHWMKCMRCDIPKIFGGGWHLSYWGDPQNIATKIQSFAHQELNKSIYTDSNRIEKRIADLQDPFDRQSLIPVDRSTIPEEILNIFEKYVDR